MIIIYYINIKKKSVFYSSRSSSESSTKRRDTPDIQSHGQVGNAVSMLATDQIFPVVLYFIDPNNLNLKSKKIKRQCHREDIQYQ